MHRSRFLGVFVDVPQVDSDAALTFWSEALGIEPASEFSDDDEYVELPGVLGDDLVFEVQAIGGGDAARFHVDIETDDVAAESDRLVSLGAELVDRRFGWTVLRAPGGHLLCVVPVQSTHEIFAATATEWS